MLGNADEMEGERDLSEFEGPELYCRKDEIYLMQRIKVNVLSVTNFIVLLYYYCPSNPFPDYVHPYQNQQNETKHKEEISRDG